MIRFYSIWNTLEVTLGAFWSRIRALYIWQCDEIKVVKDTSDKDEIRMIGE